MKNLTCLGALSMAALLFACNENETIQPAPPAVVEPNPPVQTPPIDPALATFSRGTDQMNENDPIEKLVSISFSRPLPAAGTLVLRAVAAGAVVGVDFATNPAGQNGEIVLPLDSAATSASFSVMPIQNQIVNADRQVRFEMIRATGGVKMPANSVFTLDIRDDELAGRLKKFETFAGSWRASREFSYTEEGWLKQVDWAQFTPDRIGGSYKYQYHEGKLDRVTDQSGTTTQYFWQADRVVKTEKSIQGRLMEAIEFGYDQAGNVGEMVFYHRQPNGEFVRSMVQVLLYYQDGNIYKKMVYHINTESEELTLSSTQVFEDYLATANPLPMVETLPHLNPQRHLPRSYRFETTNQTLQYRLQYTFHPDGSLAQRTVSDGIVTETTKYTYY